MVGNLMKPIKGYLGGGGGGYYPLFGGGGVNFGMQDILGHSMNWSGLRILDLIIPVGRSYGNSEASFR